MAGNTEFNVKYKNLEYSFVKPTKIFDKYFFSSCQLRSIK